MSVCVCSHFYAFNHFFFLNQKGFLAQKRRVLSLSEVFLVCFVVSFICAAFAEPSPQHAGSNLGKVSPSELDC